MAEDKNISFPDSMPPFLHSPLLMSLSQAIYRSTTANTPEELLSVISEELQRYDIACALFLLDKSLSQISPRYISENIKAIPFIENLVGLNYEEYSIPIETVPQFKHVLHSKSPFLIKDCTEVVRSWLPSNFRHLSRQIAEMLKLPAIILSPFTVEGEILGVFAIASPSLSEQDFPAVQSFSTLIAAMWKRAEVFANALEDIERRKSLEHALRQSEQRYRILVDFSPDGVLVVKDGRVVFANPSAFYLFGASDPDDLLGKNLDSLSSPEWLGLSIGRLSDLVQSTNESSPRLESQINRMDGSRVDVELTAIPVQFDGEAAVQIVLHDITERRQLETSLRESEERYRLLTESSMTGVYLIQDGLFRYVNRAMASIFGYEIEEIINRLGPFDLTHPEDHPLVSENIRLRVDNIVDDIRYSFRGIRKDGQVIHVEVHGRRIEYGGKVGIIGTLLDITEQVRHEIALRETEKFLRTIIEQIPVVVYTEDASDGHLRFISSQVEKLSGYPVEDWLKRADFWKTILHPADRERVIELDKRTNESGEMFSVDYRLITASGDEVWVRDEAVLVKDEAGYPLYWQGIMLDITDQKHHEQEIEALGRLARLSLETVDLSSLLEGVLQAAIHAIDPAEKGAILLLNESGELMIKAMVGYSDPRIQFASFPIHQGYSASCFRKRRSMIIQDARGNEEYRYDGEIEEMVAVQSAIVSPLIARGNLIGVISLENITRKNAFTEHDLRVLENLAATAALLIERSMLLDDLQRHVDHQMAINSILLAASRTNDLQSIMEIVLDHLLQAMKLEIGAIWINDPSSGQHLSATRCLPEKMIRGIQELVAWHSIDLTELEVVDNNDKFRDSNISPLLDYLGMQAYVAAPLVVNERRIGGIAIADTKPHSWSRDELSLIDTLGHQVGVLIQRGRLFEQTQKQIGRLEAVYRISTELRVAQNVDEALPILLEQTLQSINAEAGGILLYDPETNRYYPRSACGWMKDLFENIADGIEISFETKKIHIVENFFEESPWKWSSIHPVSIYPGGVSVPLFTTSHPVGLMLLSFPNPHRLDGQELALLESIADIATSAIQRMKLYEATLAQLEKLNALREIDRLIASGYDPTVIFDTVLLQVLQILDVDAASIYLYNSAAQWLERVALRGFKNAPLYKTKVHLNQSLAAEAILRREAIIIPNLSQKTPLCEQQLFLLQEGFTTYCAQPFESKGQIKGVLEIVTRSEKKLSAEWKEFLETIAQQLVIAIENAQLIQDLHRTNAELISAYDATIEGWSRALDLRDRETEGHTQRVTERVLQLALAVGIKADELIHLRRGAILHDIGKMGIPDRILLKPGPLTEEEWRIMRKHPIYAYEMLSSIDYLRPALDIPYCHHEKWDGTGYPRGLKGEAIPLVARLFAVVDVFDALTSDRPYRKAWSRERALAYIREQSGKHFDPEVVRIFLKILENGGWEGSK